MFCPQCGTESPADLKFCRTCGANLRVIGKAVTLSEAIARSDSVPAKIKDLVKNIKVEKVTDEVARAMEKMNQEIAHTAQDHHEWVRARKRDETRETVRRRRKEKTAEQRRESLLVRGFVTMFSGIGLGAFLYVLGHSIVLNLSPDQVSKVPFEVASVLHAIWLIGLIPALSGLGRVLAGFSIRLDRRQGTIAPPAGPPRIESGYEPPTDRAAGFVPARDSEATLLAHRSPDTITDRTTNILDHQPRVQQTDEIR